MNGIVLDTNVVSELFRPDHLRHPFVIEWFANLSDAPIVLNRITEAEIRTGAHGHRDNKQSILLIDYWNTLAERLPIYEFDALACLKASLFRGSRKLSGRPVSFADAAIAGIALANDCALATRNTKDFEGSNLILINPFDPIQRDPAKE